MNESQKNKRRIALAVPKIKLERKNNKSQVLTIGVGRTTILRGGADLGVIIHSTWRQTHCCIDNDQPDPKKMPDQTCYGLAQSIFIS